MTDKNPSIPTMVLFFFLGFLFTLEAKSLLFHSRVNFPKAIPLSLSVPTLALDNKKDSVRLDSESRLRAWLSLAMIEQFKSTEKYKNLDTDAAPKFIKPGNINHSGQSVEFTDAVVQVVFIKDITQQIRDFSLSAKFAPTDQGNHQNWTIQDFDIKPVVEQK